MICLLIFIVAMAMAYQLIDVEQLTKLQSVYIRPTDLDRL